MIHQASRYNDIRLFMQTREKEYDMLCGVMAIGLKSSGYSWEIYCVMLVGMCSSFDFTCVLFEEDDFRRIVFPNEEITTTWMPVSQVANPTIRFERSATTVAMGNL